MSLKKSLITGAAITAVFGLSLAALSAAPMNGPSGDLQTLTAPAYLTGMQMAHGGGRDGGRKGRFGRFCGQRGSDRLQRMIGVVEGLMEFKPDQQQAWDALKTTLKDGKSSIDKTCESLEETKGPGTAPQRLGRMEQLMASRLSALQQVRPAFDTFYATLTEKQQKALDDLFQRGRRGHRGHRR